MVKSQRELVILFQFGEDIPAPSPVYHPCSVFSKVFDLVVLLSILTVKMIPNELERF